MLSCSNCVRFVQSSSWCNGFYVNCLALTACDYSIISSWPCECVCPSVLSAHSSVDTLNTERQWFLCYHSTCRENCKVAAECVKCRSCRQIEISVGEKKTIIYTELKCLIRSCIGEIQYLLVFLVIISSAFVYLHIKPITDAHFSMFDQKRRTRLIDK